MNAGQKLRNLRESLGLRTRDVEIASEKIAAKHRNFEFAIPISRLSDIETKAMLPSIYRLYSLAVIYRTDVRDFMEWYGIDLRDYGNDLLMFEMTQTQKAEGLNLPSAVRVPVRLDPAFDLSKTSNLGRMIERWGLVPLEFLDRFKNPDYTYGFIGTEDFTMYPLVLPGSFIQVDEKRNKVMTRAWPSEFERPIYFVETRDGFICSWCAVDGDNLLLQPHPLSPVPLRILRQPTEAEVIGQVVGVAMRLDSWRYGRDAKPQRSLN